MPWRHASRGPSDYRRRSGVSDDHRGAADRHDGVMSSSRPVDDDRSTDDAWVVLEYITRHLHVGEEGLDASLNAIAVSAVERIAGCDYVGINLLVRGSFEPQVVLGEPAHELDALQKQTGRGPCIEASRDQAVVVVDDLATDHRWPEFAALAQRLGVRSMLCLPLWIDRIRLGSLSLYSAHGPLGTEERLLAQLFSAYAAVALADAQRLSNLRRAAHNRDLIGQAKGILIERHKLTPDQAFQVLSTASQRTNQTLLVTAVALIETGELPGGRSSPRPR